MTALRPFQSRVAQARGPVTGLAPGALNAVLALSYQLAIPLDGRGVRRRNLISAVFRAAPQRFVFDSLGNIVHQLEEIGLSFQDLFDDRAAYDSSVQIGEAALVIRFDGFSGGFKLVDSLLLLLVVVEQPTIRKALFKSLLRGRHGLGAGIRRDSFAESRREV